MFTTESAHYNEPCLKLPARLHNARDLTFESERTKAQAANSELTQKSARTSAELATVVLAGLELRFSGVFDALCSGCHVFLSLFSIIPQLL